MLTSVGPLRYSVLMFTFTDMPLGSFVVVPSISERPMDCFVHNYNDRSMVVYDGEREYTVDVRTARPATDLEIAAYCR